MGLGNKIPGHLCLSVAWSLPRCSVALCCAVLCCAVQARKPQVAKALNDQRKQMLQQLRQLTAGGTVGADTDDSGSSSSAVEQATAAFQYMCLAQCTAAQ